MRLLVPLPVRTAYFCASRSPGMVLRVSRIFARVPSTARTNIRVRVATPESSCRKLRPVRSAVSIARALPSSSQSELPATISSPSLRCQKISTSGSSSSKVRLNHSAPQSTPFSRVITRARAWRSGGTSRAVRSPVPMSSASARVTSLVTVSSSAWWRSGIGVGEKNTILKIPGLDRRAEGEFSAPGAVEPP